MWLKWLPWKFIVRRLAHSHGFLDPITVLSYVRRFSQPSEVMEPIELLRAGIVLHARGLMNSRAIQQNLDWIWPYWVVRQFDPAADAFIPRAFSLTHINLTHRNWSAVGVPDCHHLPIVDPRGLVTPLMDQWSIDAWVVSNEGRLLAPSRSAAVEQAYRCDENLCVVTRAEDGGLSVESEADVMADRGEPACRIRLSGTAEAGGWLILALRPYNPEGVSFIHKVELEKDRCGWKIDGKHRVRFDRPAERHAVSDYHSGDVSMKLLDRPEGERMVCDVGMSTAAAMFKIDAGKRQSVEAFIPLNHEKESRAQISLSDPGESWRRAMEGHCAMEIPDERQQFLYDVALRMLILHSPDEVYPGPYTYKRFWFRDAAFIIHALICSGMMERVERALDRFPALQTPFGYFHSQEGEWDSNGEALWIFRRFCDLTGRKPKPEWMQSIRKGAQWIKDKRLSEDLQEPYAGLLPAGFSAEHLGPNDYYYWDDFWSVAGLRSAAKMLRLNGNEAEARRCDREAESFMGAIERSLKPAAERLGRPAMPAAPTRRFDAGAIGSLAAGYPLMLMSADDERLLDTAAYLMEAFFIHGGFFQEMIHSGVNAYLTLHIAQVLMRAGDERFADLTRAVADLATPTGQWPEAIHPRTRGGCMGDGQHVWAAAEWVVMMRNSFVFEDEGTGRLVIGAGIVPEWLDQDRPLRFGPAPTSWGTVDIEIIPNADGPIVVQWNGRWFGEAPEIEVRLPGREPMLAERGSNSLKLERTLTR